MGVPVVLVPSFLFVHTPGCQAISSLTLDKSYFHMSHALLSFTPYAEYLRYCLL